MALLWNLTDVKDCMDVCFEHKTEADLKEGETFESLINPPNEVRQTTPEERAERPYMGTTVTIVDHSPYPWGYKKDEEDGSEDRTRIIRMNPATFVLIHNVSTVGIDKITEKNWKEVWTRLNIVEHIFTNGFGGEDQPTGRGTATMPRVVLTHIGMRLPNTHPLTPKQFNSKMGEWLRKDAEKRLDFLMHHYPEANSRDEALRSI